MTRRGLTTCTTLISITLAALAVSSSALAQPARSDGAPRRRDAIQADLGLAVVGLAYERILGDHFALQAEGQLFGTWFLDANFTGGGVQLRPTVFLFGVAPRGLYLSEYLRADVVTAKGAERATLGGSAGTVVGGSFMLGERVNVRIGAGVQLMHYELVIAGRVEKTPLVYPALDLVVGYAL